MNHSNDDDDDDAIRVSSSVCIIVYSCKYHDPVECQYGTKKIMLSLIGYQFDRVITEERRRLLGIVQGISIGFFFK